MRPGYKQRICAHGQWERHEPACYSIELGPHLARHRWPGHYCDHIIDLQEQCDTLRGECRKPADWRDAAGLTERPTWQDAITDPWRRVTYWAFGWLAL